MAVTNELLAENEIGRLISADKVKGTAVHNTAGDSLGSIESIMIDKPSDKVAYAVLAFGGILGMGKDRRALPWNLLTYDTTQEAYIVSLDPEILRGGPAYEETDWDDTDWDRKVHDYYDARPSWIPPAD